MNWECTVWTVIFASPTIMKNNEELCQRINQQNLRGLSFIKMHFNCTIGRFDKGLHKGDSSGREKNTMI